MKNVVITGSSRGFGNLTALTLARKGYRVWATMRNVHDKNLNNKNKLLSIAKKERLQILVEELDVTDDQSVSDAISGILRKDGKIDMLVNNAGVMFLGITEAYTLHQAKEQFEVNFFGILRTTRAVLPCMRANKDGLIINISSLAGRLSFPYFSIYCASKHALESYSRALHHELAPFGIEVSIVEPAPFKAGLLYSGPKEADVSVLSDYGDRQKVPEAMLKSIEEFLNGDQAPNPQSVADNITRVIETAKGQRPCRIV